MDLGIWLGICLLSGRLPTKWLLVNKRMKEMDAGAGRTEPCLLTISREEQHLDVPGLLIEIFHFHLHFLMFPLDLIDSFVDFFTFHHAGNFLLSLSLKRYTSSHTDRVFRTEAGFCGSVCVKPPCLHIDSLDKALANMARHTSINLVASSKGKSQIWHLKHSTILYFTWNNEYSVYSY